MLRCSSGVKHEVAIRGGAAVRAGHLAAIKGMVASNDITDVVLNFSTTASHLSRISQALQPAPDSKRNSPPVIVKDRTGVVLEIFRKHATSAEAHLQVRLAGLHSRRHTITINIDAAQWASSICCHAVADCAAHFHHAAPEP